MIDLNGTEFQDNSVKIFNGGKAGKVENVSIELQKRSIEDPVSYPDYKLIATDSFGGQVNIGFYKAANLDDEKQSKNASLTLRRLMSIARAVLGKDYNFPTVPNFNDGIDTISQIILENTAGKTFNVFVTYGTVGYPNKRGFLGFRFFDFIEAVSTPVEESKLRPKGDDLLTPIVPDAQEESAGADTTESW